MSNKYSIVAILQGTPVQKGQGPLFTFPRNRDSKYYWIYYFLSLLENKCDVEADES